jgi:hypothetical protein
MPRLAELVVRMKDLEEVHAVIEALGVAVMALEEIRHQFPDTESIDVRIGRYDLAREVAEEAILAIDRLLPPIPDAPVEPTGERR